MARRSAIYRGYRTLDKPSPFPGRTTAVTARFFPTRTNITPAYRAQRIYEPSRGEGQDWWHTKTCGHRKKYASTLRELGRRQSEFRERRRVEAGRAGTSATNSSAKVLLGLLLEPLLPLQLDSFSRTDTTVWIVVRVCPSAQKRKTRGDRWEGAGRAGQAKSVPTVFALSLIHI